MAARRSISVAVKPRCRPSRRSSAAHTVEALCQPISSPRRLRHRRLPGKRSRGPLPPAQHPAGRVRRPRLPGVLAVQLHQQHAVPSVRGVLGGHVLEVGVDHRRAGPLDQPAGDHAVLCPPRVPGLGRRPVRVAVPVADVHVRRPALPAPRAVTQVQVGQVQPAQLADPEPPSASHVTTSRSRAVLTASSSRSRAPSGGSFGCRRRCRGGASGLAGSSRWTWPRNARCRSARDGSRASCSCEPSSGLTPSSACCIEALHARRGRRQGTLAERAPPGPPRLAIRPAPRRAQRRHVTPQVLQ